MSARTYEHIHMEWMRLSLSRLCVDTGHKGKGWPAQDHDGGCALGRGHSHTLVDRDRRRCSSSFRPSGMPQDTSRHSDVKEEICARRLSCNFAANVTADALALSLPLPTHNAILSLFTCLAHNTARWCHPHRREQR